MFYLIRNPETGRWVNTWFNAAEADNPAEVAAKFGSYLSARQTARNLVKKHKAWNEDHTADLRPVRYEIVAFRLVQSEVLFVAA